MRLATDAGRPPVPLPERHDDPPALFGQPSTYSLSPAELAAEIRRRRRQGWQSWEIRQRFTFGSAA